MAKPIPRELTAAERREIRRLVVGLCANYDSEYGCLPLDCECYMLNKWWTGSLCKYFKGSVLPTNPILERALKGKPPANTKPCAICGKRFPVAGVKPTVPISAGNRGSGRRTQKGRKSTGRTRGEDITD